MRTTIKQIVSVKKLSNLVITTILDADGNEATGVGEFKVGDPIIVYFDDKYNKCKFHLRKQPRQE